MTSAIKVVPRHSALLPELRYEGDSGGQKAV